MATTRKTQKQVHFPLFRLTAVKYRNGAFIIGRAAIEGGELTNRTVNIKGDFPDDGDNHYEAIGSLETHPRYGDSYKLTGVQVTMPKDRLGVINYLVKEFDIAFPHANAIVTRYGPDVKDVLDRADAERLVSEIDGIDLEIASEFLDRWHQARDARDIEKLLVNAPGIGTKTAARIVEWCQEQGTTVAEILQDNPYRLMDAPRVGWRAADAIALDYGVTYDDPRRIVAACSFVVQQEERNGHTWMPKDVMLVDTSKLLDLPSHTVMNAVMSDTRAALLIIDEQQRCYRAQMLRCETSLADGIRRLMDSYSNIAGDIERLDWSAVFSGQEMTLTDEQQDAVKFVLSHKVSILTGGAGTGKSTVQRTVLAALEAAGIKQVALCAPTGKAARRLEETAGRAATTVHRLVPKLEKAIAEDTPLPDVVIVDEASMLDTEVGEWLISRLPSSCHLVLVGDDNQLPSVGAGRVLYDCIVAGIPTFRLTKVLRQAGKSLIIKTSHDINTGVVPEITNANGDDMYFFEIGDPERVAENIIRLITEAIPSKFGIEADDVTVIAPQKNKACGVEALNIELQARLNPASFEKNEVRWYDKTIREGDKLVWTANNYDIGLVNGEEVRVESIYQDDEGKTRIDLDMATGILLEDMTALHGYAITGHKAQGSEYPCAIVVCHSTHQFMLTRRWLYTAVTRGKQVGIIIGEREALRKAVGNVREDSRRTGLQERLMTCHPIFDNTEPQDAYYGLCGAKHLLNGSPSETNAPQDAPGGSGGAEAVAFDDWGIAGY